MHDLLEQFKAPEIFASGCDVSTGKFSPLLSVDECRPLKRLCNDHSFGAISCRSPLLNETLRELDGLEFNLKLQSVDMDLPSYLPVVSRRVFKGSSMDCEQEIIAITLDDILKTGLKREAYRLSIPQQLNFPLELLKKECFRNKKVILFGTGQDTLIEKIWKEKNQSRFFELIGQMGFAAVTGINFSLFYEDCPISHAINLKRSLLSSYLFQNAGVPSIPHMYALHKFHVERWIKWLKENSEVKIFTVNCQLQKAKNDIDLVVSTVTRILDTIADIKVILQGFRVDHLYKLQKFGSRIVLADSGPTFLSHSNYVYNYFSDGKTRIRNNDLSKSQIIAYNISQKTAKIADILYKEAS